MTRQSFAVIGLGRFGSAMARTLVEMGQDVVGIDANEGNVQGMSETLQTSSGSTPPTSAPCARPASRTSTWP